MKKLHLIILLGIALAMVGAVSAQAGGSAKVNVCHIPPGNPTNWHTITIGESALPAHLAHGDLAGTCEANCDALCSDGNPCTQDVDPQAAECTCLDNHPPVNCDDSSLCTTDSCDPDAGGCVYAPIDCSDGSLCTVDTCVPATGQCVSTPIACGEGELCDETTGTCYDPCSGVVCEPLDQCHVAGTCTAGECDDPVAPDGTACDDGDAGTTGDVCTDGVCAGEPIPVDPCDPNPCLNDGSCSPTTPILPAEPDFVCACPYGWTGDLCETATCPCDHPDFPDFQSLVDGSTPVSQCFRDEFLCLIVFSTDPSACEGSQGVVVLSGPFPDYDAGALAGSFVLDGEPVGTACASTDGAFLPANPEQDALCQGELEAAIAESGVTCITSVCQLPVSDGFPCDDGNPDTDEDACQAGVCVGLPTP
jgi:EGF-like domain/Dictyostelium (slime mold) repeat